MNKKRFDYAVFCNYRCLAESMRQMDKMQKNEKTQNASKFSKAESNDNDVKMKGHKAFAEKFYTRKTLSKAHLTGTPR